MRRPFISDSHLLKANRMVHDWGDLTTLLPSGTGLCLDLGAGDGRFKPRIERQGWSWIGIDVVSAPDLTAVADARCLPFVANSINIVFTNQVLEHIPQPWLVVGEVFRILKTGGQLVGSVSFLDPFHDSYLGFSHWGVQELLESHGFELEEIRPGTSVFCTLASALLPDTRWGSLIGKWTGRALMAFLQIFGGLYMAIRFGRQSHEWKQYQDFLMKVPLRFAGHIMFVARKPTPSNSFVGPWRL